MASISLSYIEEVRLAHGVLASLAWVVFFPVGAIIIRVMPGPMAIWIHAAFQFFAYALFITAVGLGIHLALYIDAGTGLNLIGEYHPVIGLVVFSLVFFQPILGYVHHIYFKKHSRRTVWSHAHIWLGRILLTLAMINGGLGLLFVSDYQAGVEKGYIVYGVFAGLIWIAYVASAIYGEVKKTRTTTDGGKSISNSVDSNGADPEKVEDAPAKNTDTSL